MATTVPVLRQMEISIGDGVESFGDINVGGGASTAAVALAAAVAQLPTGHLTATITSTASSSSLRINTSTIGGGSVLLTIASGSTTTARASELKTAIDAASFITTFFRASVSGSTVTLKPRYPWSMLREVELTRVSGTGVTFLNSDGTTITSTVDFAKCRMGGTIRIGRGLYDDSAGSAAALDIETPGVRIEAEPGATWVASRNGWISTWASGFRLEGLDLLWPEEGGSARSNLVLILINSSEFDMVDVTMTIDSIGTSGAPLYCFGIASAQPSYPTIASYDYRRMGFTRCKFYLGNRTTGLYMTSVQGIDVTNCLFTCKFARTAPTGHLNPALHEAPWYAALFFDCDYINWTDSDAINFGGHTDATNTDAAVKVLRILGAGYNNVSETGHVIFKGGRFHGNRDHVASDLRLGRCWFARVEGVEFHRRLTLQTHSPAHPYQDVASLLVDDCQMTTVVGCEWFNLGGDGSDNVNFPAIGVLSQQVPTGASGGAGGDTSKILNVTGCTYDNKAVAANDLSDNMHPFLFYYNTKNGHRFHSINVNGCTMITGGQSVARVTVDTPEALVAGDGITFSIPANTFGSGNPASLSTIVCRANPGFQFNRSVGNVHLTAQAMANVLNNNSLFNVYFTAELIENAYGSAASAAGGTVIIRSREYSTRGNACTIQHNTVTSGHTTVTVGNSSPTDVTEGATTALEGGYGEFGGGGHVAFLLSGDSGNAFGTVGPRAVNISGNNFIGGWTPVLDADQPTDDINDWLNENVIAGGLFL